MDKLNLKAMAALQPYITGHKKWGPAARPDKFTFFMFALAGEVGEACSHLKKDWRGDPGKEKRRKKVIKELADIGNYYFMACAQEGVDPFVIMLAKMRVVERRKEFRRRQALRDKQMARRGRRAALLSSSL